MVLHRPLGTSLKRKTKETNMTEIPTASATKPKTPIQFEPPQNLGDILNVPQSGASHQNGGSQSGKFRDLTLKPAFAKRVHRFVPGLTWIRFLPAIKGSRSSWMHRFQQYAFPQSKFVDAGRDNPVEVAKQWLRENEPKALYTKAEKTGFKLWSKEMGIAWIIDVAAPKGQRLKIFLSSLYDGVRGGAPGLAFRITDKVMEVGSEPGSANFGQRIYPDITDPREGRLVGVTRQGTDQTTSYDCKIGSAPHGLPNELLCELLTDDELEMVVPIENVLATPDESTVEELLRDYIGKELCDRMTVPAAAVD
jgi:hypothetical protein